MFKLFYIGALLYLLYRVIIIPFLGTPKQAPKANIKAENPKEKKIDDNDYIEYEEVD